MFCILVVRKLLNAEGLHADRLINADHSADCILDAMSGVPGNALYYAVSKNRYDMADILLEYGADIYATGEY